MTTLHMNLNKLLIELQKRVAQFRHGTRHPFGLGVSPKHISMEIDALLRRDGHAILQPSGALPSELSAHVNPELAQQTILLAWRFLHELFDESGLLQKWLPLRIVAMTQASMEVNGLAGQVTDPKVPYFYIGLHAGVFLHTTDRLMRLMAEPRCLPDIGNPQMESANRSGELLQVIPHDEVRKNVAIDLAMIAIVTVFAHEVGHIVRGHLWLLKTKFGISRLYEADSSDELPPTDPHYTRIRRALELDADIFAGKVMGTMLFAGTTQNLWPSLGQDKRQLLRLLAMSVTCAFRGFSSQSASDFYHTPFMRAQMLAIAAKDMAAEKIPFDMEDFRLSAWLIDHGPANLGLNPLPKVATLHQDTDKLKETLSLLGELESELAASHLAMDKQFSL